MGMSLPHGGHLSPRRARSTTAGSIWKAVHYGVDPATGRIDYDQVREQAKREQPRLIIAGGSAYARIIDFAAFRSIADEVGAIFLVDMAHFAGLVAGGVYPSPVPHAPGRHQHHAQDAARPSCRTHPLHRASTPKAIDKSVFPGTQGGPLEHVIAAKAVAFGEALTDDFKVYARQVVENAKALAAGADRSRLRHRLRRHRHAPDAGGPAAQEPHRQGGGEDCSTRPASRSTRTRSRTTRSRRSSPAASGSARRRSPPAAWAPGEMERIAELIDRALTRPDEATLARVRAEVEELSSTFPLYQSKSAAGRVRRSA